MANFHGKATQTFVDKFNLSGYFRSANVSRSIETADTTFFGSTNKSYIVGLGDGTLQLDGMWSPDATLGSDVVLSNLISQSATPIVTFAYGSAIGTSCIIAKARSTSYDISSPVSDVVSASVSFQATTDGTTNYTRSISNGVLLTAGASIAFGSVSTALTSVDNLASSANGGAANFHVTANSITGGTTTIKVQHSSDNSTWVDLITFTAVGASTTAVQQSAVSGTVNRYLRTGGSSTAGTAGSITYNIGFARF